MSQRRATTWFDFLVPACCLGCGDTAALRGLGLCEACRRRMREAGQPSCRICGRSLSGGGRCGSCAARAVPYQRLLAGWLYLPPCDRVITALKFRGLEYLGGELAQSLAERYRAELAEFNLVVPVPLHWGRRWRRGYNQAEKIASPLARALGLAISPALRRNRRTRPQTSLGRGSRLQAMSGAFVAAGACELAGARVILVDDVATTGATLAAAAAALVEAGAGTVTALVAARVPGPGEAV